MTQFVGKKEWSGNAKHSCERFFFQWHLFYPDNIQGCVWIWESPHLNTLSLNARLYEKNSQISQVHVYVSFHQMSAEKEMKDSDRLFASLIRTVEEGRAEVNIEIMAKQKFAEMRSEELIKELQKEIAELQCRNAELEELADSEDHLHLLQVQSRSDPWETSLLTKN